MVLSRIGSTKVRVVAAVLVVAATLVTVGHPVSASNGYVTFPDVHGVDDAGAQADLVSTAVDYGHLDDLDPKLFVQWNWDETRYSGNNSGDACALFDTTGDGLANYAVCVSIGGNPAAQLVDSPRLYECTSNNLSNNRCNGDTEVTGFTTTCTVAIVGTDTVAGCEIDMDDVGGSDATLLNTCSFNSSEPNSNPPDCVFEPGMGIEVVKDVTDDALIASTFDVVIAGVGTVTRTITGDGTLFVPAGNGTHSVTEISTGDGYGLASSSCTSGTPSAISLILGGTQSSTCTFVNQAGVPSSTTVKTFSPASVVAGTTGHGFTIAVTNDGSIDLTGVNITDTVDATLQVTGVSSDLGGDCSASSGNSIDCTVSTIPAGQTATVTVAYSVASTVEPTTVTNTASVTSTELPTPQTATDSLAITEDVDLAVTKAFTTTPAAGTTGNTFTIVVTNSGTSDAENVSITDVVDTDLTVTGVAIAPVGDCAASSGQLVDCTIADLAAGQSVVITVAYDVDESLEPTTIANTATAQSDESGPVSHTTSTTVIEDVDLAMVKTFGSDPVSAGAMNRRFALAVTNNGTSDAENILITDTVDPTLIVDSVTSDLADCSASAGQSVNCTVAGLASGQTVTVTVTYHVHTSTDSVTVTNTAAVNSDEDTATATTTVDVVEDVVLDLVKSFDSGSAVAGSSGNSFSLELTNTGISGADNIVITDTVDSRLTVTAVSSPSLDCSGSSGQTVSCVGAGLAAGATATATVTYEVDSTTEPATVSNTATAASDEDTTTATDTVDVTEDVVLSATKTFLPETAPAGSSGNTFAITVTNSGASDADNVTVTDTVDATLQVTGVATDLGDCSASSGQNVNCSIPSLDGGRSATITVTYTIDAGATLGTAANTAAVASDEASTTASDSVDVVADVGFQVVKEFAGGSAEAGSTGHSFTIGVTNTGPSDATGVTIADVVDAALVVTAVSSAGADCSASVGQSINCSLPVLAAGETTTVTVTYDVPESTDAGTISNTATVDSNESAPTSATDSVDIVEDVVLSATKTFAAGTVAAGSAGESFTITVANTGSSDADNIVITDTVDSNLEIVSVSSASASCTTAQSFTCTAAALGGGESLTVLVTYDVDLSAPATTVTNTANVTSDEGTTSASDTVDIVEDVVLELEKFFDDATVAAGVAGRTFSLTATNTGSSDAENISLTDTVAAPLVVTAVEPGAGLDCSASFGNSIDCSTAVLDPGQSVTVTVTYDVDASADPATVTNTAVLASDEAATAASDSIDVVEDVDLSVTKAFGSLTNTAGGTGYSFTIAVSNAGLSDAENVAITDVVAPALTVTGVSITTGDCSASTGNTVDCSIPVLDGGASTTVTVTYDVDADIATSTVANTATATSDEATASATTSVEIDEQVTLAATKAFAANQVVAGQSSNFTISVSNTGMSTADNVTITDTVDAALNLTGVTATAGDCTASTATVVDCTVASMAPGQAVTVTATFDVDADTDPATVANTASIASDEVVAITASDTVDITEEVDLDITKAFASGLAAVGSSGNTFTITVTNTGASTADNVEITDAVDASLTVVGVSATTGDCSGTVGNNVDCEIASLAGGTTATITVTYDVEPWVSGGVVSNVASVLSDEVGPISAVDSVELVEDVELAVTKTFTASPVTAGSVGNTFTIEVTNNGQSTADQVAVTDTVAAVLTVDSVRVSPDGDCSASVGNDVDCVIDSLRPGQSILITVTYDVPSTANTSTVSNTASANSGDAPIPVTATASVDVVEDVALSVTKAFTADPVIAGTGGHGFTVSVANTGQSSADSVHLTDSVDTALTISSISSATADCSASSGNDIDCTVASLAPGATATVDVGYAVDTSVPAGIVTNTAAAASAEVTTPVTASDTVTVVEDVDLSVNKTFGTTTATAGVAGYTFSLSATNNGLSDAENVSITDTVDADLTVLAVTPTAGGDCSGSSGQVVDCTFATVAAGDTATVTVAYEVLSGATTPRTVTNTGQITSDEVPPIAAVDSVALDAVVVFDFEKVFAGSTVAAGSTGRSFTITAYNSGPSDASGITIGDPVDPRLTVTAVNSATADCSASSGQIVDCSLATLPVGQAAVVTVYYDVDDSVEPATVVNQAEVSSTVPGSTATISAPIDVVEDVDLVAAKAFGPATVAAGSTANTFTISTTNNGLSEADNVSIVDTVDAALAVTAVSAPSGDCSASIGNTVDCVFATLGPGQTATVTVTYDVAESLDPATVSNTADVTSDEVLTPVQPSATVTVIEDATLVIDKVFVDSPVTAGSNANTFTVSVTNTGLSDAENLAITDTVDSALIITLVTIDSGDCSASSGQVVDCTVPTLAAGATVTVTVTHTVDGSAPASSVVNTATASSDEQAPITDTATVAIVEDVDLSVSKVFSPNPATAGTAGNSFTIIVTNNGTSNADNVAVTDTVAAQLQVGSVLISPAGSCAAPSQTISCSTPSLSGGESLTVTVGYTLDADLPAGSVTNTASAISDEMTAPAYGTADLQIERDVDLNATKTFLTDPVVAGATGYNVAVTVTNSGVSTSDPVAVTDIVDTEFTVTNVSTTTGDCSASAGNTVDCTLDPLAPGSSGTVTVTYDVDAAAMGTISNTATVDSDTLVSPLDATDTVTIVEDVSLTLNKTFGTATATAGVSGYTFTLAVTNSGPSQADNLSITDTVDSALTVVGVTTPDGDCSATVGNNIDCTVAALGPGATTTVTVTYDVDAAATGTVTNTATVTSDEDTAVGWDTIDVVTDSALTADKAFASPVVIAGSSSSFSITVANGGPSDASALTVSDTVDARLSVTSVTTTVGDCSASAGQSIDCTIPTLASGQATVITVDYEVASSVNPDTVTNTATVTHGITLLTPGDSVDIVEDVNLTAVKTFLGSGTGGTTGNSFTIAVTNVGASDADNLVITDTVDPRLEVSAVSVAPTGTCQSPSSNLRCDVATLAAGSTTTVTVVFDLADDTTGTVTNSAQVSADGMAPFTATDTLAVAAEADLSVTKTASAAVAGDAVTFIVTVANAGPSRADAVTVTESMPPELTNPVFNPGTGSYDPATGRWTGLALAAGDEALLTVIALMPADHDGPLVNQVSVAPVGAVDPDLDNNDASAQTLTTRLTDLELTKTLDTENPVAGTPVQYTMVVTNNGPGAALHAPVVDEVGRLMSTAAWTCEATGSSLASCSRPVGDGDVEVDVNLMPGDTATIIMTGTLLPTLEGELVNSASVDGSAESDFSDNTSSVAAPVAQQANLQLAKAARIEVDGDGASQAFSVGDTITYDLTVVNDGPSQAPDAVVTDNLPDGVEFVAAIAERGRCVEADLVVTCSVGDMPVGDSVTVTVQLRPTRAVAGKELVNNASAASGATDVEATGNTAFAEVPIAGGSPLAFTGADTRQLLVAGMILIGMGAAVIWSSRRRFPIGRRVD